MRKRDMPHFTILTDNDGRVQKILRDGEPYNERVTLEPPHQIVSTYFKIARANLDAMKTVREAKQKRHYGLQAFLMSLTGVEAFTNVFFQLRARERGNPKLAKRAEKQGPLVERLRACLVLAFDEPLPEQDTLLDRIQKLYRLRNDIVHPRWQPVSVSMSGLAIDGVCQNFQATFDDQDFCEEAYWWCVNLVAQVGLASGNEAIEGPCFYWAGLYMLTQEVLAEKLGLKT